MYLLLYSLGRFFIEDLRGDQLIFDFFGSPLSVARTMSVAAILAATILHLVLQGQDLRKRMIVQ